uniref:Nidogen 2 n=1 Tax=Eptatretus burgeri TaxID=7764 RepID=A0A8C4NB86_EPTBU
MLELTLVLALLFAGSPVRAIGRHELLPYGSRHGDLELPAGDDAHSQAVDLPFAFPYFTSSFSTLHVSTNGLLSPKPLQDESSYINGPLPTSFPALAAFLLDLDTGSGHGHVLFRVSVDPVDSSWAAGHIHRAFPTFSSFNPHAIFVCTWDSVPAHRGHVQQSNTFQLVLASDEDDTFALLLYPEHTLQVFSTPPKEERKDLTETPARVGFSQGSRTVFFIPVEGSSYEVTSPSNPPQQLPRTSNSGRKGIWAFRVGSTGRLNNIQPAEIQGDIEDEPEDPSGHGVPLPIDYDSEDSDEYDDDFEELTEAPIPAESHFEAGDRRGDWRTVENPRGIRPYPDVVGVPETQAHPEPHFVEQPFENEQIPVFGDLPLPKRSSTIINIDDIEVDAKVFQYNPTRVVESCAKDGTSCSPHTSCRDHSTGFCCYCNNGYYGDGHLCLPEGLPQRVNGKVSGRIFLGSASRPVEFLGVDMHSYIVVNDGRTYTAVSQISEEIGWSMLPLYSMAGIMGWMFALEQPDFHNGFSITGGRFTRHANITFLPGREQVSIVQHLNGMDEHGHLTINTRIDGQLPLLPPGVTLSVNKYEEIYHRSYNVITSSAAHEYTVDFGQGRHETFQHQWKQNITWEGCLHDVEHHMSAHRQRLTAERIFTLYDVGEKILRYATTNMIGSVTDPVVENPCYDGSHHCDSNAQCQPGQGQAYACECAVGYAGDGRACYDRDECGERADTCGAYAHCVNMPGTFRCECHEGYHFAVDGQSCIPHTPVNPCDTPTHGCDYSERAHCVPTGPSTHRCECLPGFTGNGHVCSDIDECRSSRCDPHATCYNSPGSFSCRCNPGYHGDGFQCIPLQGHEGHEKSKCEQWRDSMLAASSQHGSRPSPSFYLPQCETDGTFSPVQCHSDAGYCWCVNEDGSEIPGTRSPHGTEPPCLPTAAPTSMQPSPRPDVDPPPPGSSLLFAQGQLITHIPLAGSTLQSESAHTVISLHGSITVGLAFDCVDNMIYWTDIAGKTINRASLNGGEPQVIINTGLLSPEGLAIDHLGRNAFWTDSGTDRIEVSKLDGSQRRVLFDTGLVNPRAIVVDAPRGHMYWTDWNREAPKIETAYMDGSERRVLVSEDLGLPNGLTFDPYSRQLCWADAGTKRLECVYPSHGTRRRFLEGLRYPFSLTGFSGHLYYTDWRRDAVVSATLNQELEEHLPPQRSHPYGITTVFPQCPPGNFFHMHHTANKMIHVRQAVPTDCSHASSNEVMAL